MQQAPLNEIENIVTKKFKVFNKDRITLKFCKISENAFTPTKGSKLAAGYDLYR